MKLHKIVRGRGKLAVILLGAMASVFSTLADSPDSLYFVTGGSLDSTEILSTSAGSPTTVFEGVNLEDYEPAYAYFNLHNPVAHATARAPRAFDYVVTAKKGGKVVKEKFVFSKGQF